MVISHNSHTSFLSYDGANQSIVQSVHLHAHIWEKPDFLNRGRGLEKADFPDRSLQEKAKILAVYQHNQVSNWLFTDFTQGNLNCDSSVAG